LTFFQPLLPVPIEFGHQLFIDCIDLRVGFFDRGGFVCARSLSLRILAIIGYKGHDRNDKSSRSGEQSKYFHSFTFGFVGFDADYHNA
jgi:hypothetical protein